MHMMLSDPTGQIESECGDKSMKREDVALTYSLALRDERSVPVDWSRANKAILARWSPSGLNWIKERAWAICQAGEYQRPAPARRKKESS